MLRRVNEREGGGRPRYRDRLMAQPKPCSRREWHASGAQVVEGPIVVVLAGGGVAVVVNSPFSAMPTLSPLLSRVLVSLPTDGRHQAPAAEISRPRAAQYNKIAMRRGRRR